MVTYLRNYDTKVNMTHMLPLVIKWYALQNSAQIDRFSKLCDMCHVHIGGNLQKESYVSHRTHYFVKGNLV